MRTDKCIVSCALTGVLTDPDRFPVPVTPAQMAAAAKEAFDAGASIVHCHFRDQRPKMGFLPTWDTDVAKQIIDAIRACVPEIVINMSTGTVGPDVSGPLACLNQIKPEIAALNAGSLNYLKIHQDGRWAWPPLLFDNPVEKIQKLLNAMQSVNAIPECECFDTGHIRSIDLFEQNGILQRPFRLSLIMGVQSGMPSRPEWIPLLVREIGENIYWQVIAIGRQEVWPLHRKCAELGGHVRTGLEDTFYLPSGKKTASNGKLIEAAAKIIHETGRAVASPTETRQMLGISRHAPK